MSQSDLDRQKSLNASTGKNRLRYGRLLVPPTLVIESISMGHADHDRETKRRWYAEFGVPNYWLLDAYEQTLECLKLDRTDYAVDCAGRGESELRPSSFPGLLIPLRTVWGE
jgi:Uma2 family endonuclease